MSIEKARLHIHDNYDKPLDLASLASVSHLSSYHFSRLFKEATGDTPMSYVRNFRLEKAVHFLANTNLSVSEIAYRCGFNSLSSFNGAFAKKFGRSPTEVRKPRKSRNREEISNNKEENHADLPHNLHKSLLRRIWDMNVKIKDFPDYRIAYFRHVGSYLNTGVNWERLIKWVSEKNLFTTDPLFIGISRDDPAITEDDACRHDACVTLPAGFEETREKDVMYDTIAAGRYGVYEFYDTLDKLALAYRSLFSEWLPQSGYELDGRPCLEINLNNPAEDPEHKGRCDICLPIKELR